MENAQTGRTGRGLVRLYRTVAVLAAGVGLSAAVAAPAAAAAQSGEPKGSYCTRTSHKPGCFTPLNGRVNYLGCGEESHGGDVDIVVRNPNRRQAPRDIAVFVLRDEGNGPKFVEIFGDRDWAAHGRNVTQYRGLANGTYRLTVGWADQGLTFYGSVFTVECEGPNGTLPHPLRSTLG